MEGKLYLIDLPLNHESPKVITPSGIFDVKFVSNGVHHLHKDGMDFEHFGKVYQMCFIDYASSEAYKVPVNDWRLCTKYIPRINGKLVIGLTDSEGKPHKNHNTVKAYGHDEESVFIFKPVSV